MGSRSRNSTRSASPRAGNADLDRPTGPARAAAIAGRLADQWPDAVVELDHANAYQLLVATILAAQSTDKLINTVTPKLFARYPDPAALAAADQAELESMIFSTGFYRMKARHLIGMARRIVENHGGQVPDTMEGLTDLPGVARKTANVVLGSALGKNEGIVVDTHVSRLAPRLGLTTQTDPVKIEQDLMQLVARDQWSRFAHRLIWHGRRVCHARKPDCEHCTLAPMCPSAGIAGTADAAGAERTGRAPAPSRAQRAKAAKAKLDATARGGASGTAGQIAKVDRTASNGRNGKAGNVARPVPGGRNGEAGNVAQPAPGGRNGEAGTVARPAPSGRNGKAGNVARPAPGERNSKAGNVARPAPGGRNGEAGKLAQAAPTGRNGKPGKLAQAAPTGRNDMPGKPARAGEAREAARPTVTTRGARPARGARA
jgi:endonuclease-3